MIKRVLSVVFAAALLVGLLSVFPVAANATSGMSISQECVERIKEIEGFHAIPFWDYSQWTVGFGSTCPADKLEQYKAEGIPMAEANRLMMEQLAKFEESVNKFADKHNMTLTQGQFDALVSMTYNLGAAMLSNTENRVYKAITQGATGNDLIFAFSVYCTAGGEFLPGLIRRRLVEANMYLNGWYDDYAPENYCYVLYDGNGGTRDVVAQGYDCNLAARPLSVPTYAGHTFVGWYTAATGGTKVTTLDETTHGMTLYARWEKGEDTAETEKNVDVTVTAEAVNVRTGPGVDYAICAGVFRDEIIRITGVTVVDGIRWGRFSKGWICLSYTNYAALTGDYDVFGDDETGAEQIELPIKATVLHNDGATIYNGPHATYPKLKTLKRGTEIEITEIHTLYGVVWGKCADGWVKLDLRILLDDAQKLAHSFKVTINYQYYLNVRSGPGTNYSKVTTLQNGTEVEIVAVEYAGDTLWGRCSVGWIHMGYTSFDETLLEQYRYHSYGDWRLVQEGTCVSEGVERRDCALCDHYETRQAARGDHSYGDWYVVQEGTCETPSQERRDCQYCDGFETRENALGGHSYGDWYETVAATCQTPGQERRDCQICGTSETRETAPANHDYDAWTTYAESTCQTPGEERRVCLTCGYTESRALALADHTFGQWYETVTPTAETDGEERRDCQYCDAYETRTVEKTEHIYGDWYVVEPASCETDGLERRDCQHCQEEYQTRVIPATGHNMDNWYELNAPSCTEPGVECRACLTCGTLETREIAATGHNMSEWIVVEKATCDKDGLQVRACKICSTLEEEILPAIGHKFSNWVTVAEPTCTAEGEQWRACVTCNYMEKQSIPALEHVLGDWYIATEATCGQVGQERRDCANCDYYEARELTATDHKLGQWYDYRQPSCGVDGEQRRDCANCDYYESRAIAATDHVFGEWYSVSLGQERRDCTVCGSFELRTTDVPVQTVTKVYGIVEDYHVHVRSGAGTEYPSLGKLFYGDRVEILEQKTVSGATWGRIGDGRWVCLAEDFAVETVEEMVAIQTKVYATVTYTLLNIRQSPDHESAAVGYFLKGDRVEILEQMSDSAGRIWGRVEKGWICLTDYTKVETITISESMSAEVVIQVMGTVTYNGLMNIRSGCGVGYSKIGTLPSGSRVEILEFNLAGSQVWGRIEAGWIRIDGYVALEMIRQEMTDGHTFGQWYAVTEPTCTQEGQERRDCSTCGEFETRSVAATGHNFSNWAVAQKATCVSEGMEARVCPQCMVSETRTLPMTDHSYGSWYTVKEATATTPGQERRDCTVCGKYQTRETDLAQGTTQKVYGVVTGYSYVNIRAGVGTSYTLLGTLQYGDRVEILEQKTDSYGRNWGRISSNGWVCITGYLTLKTVDVPTGGGTTITVEKTYGVVTANALNIRGGAGAGYDYLGQLYKGTLVEIFEQKVDGNGLTWGRISENCWVPLTGYTTVYKATETVNTGDWYLTMKINTSRLYIYNTTSTSGSSLGFYVYASRVEILEYKVVDGTLWARTLQGWILGENLI